MRGHTRQGLDFWRTSASITVNLPDSLPPRVVRHAVDHFFCSMKLQGSRIARVPEDEQQRREMFVGEVADGGAALSLRPRNATVRIEDISSTCTARAYRSWNQVSGARGEIAVRLMTSCPCPALPTVPRSSRLYPSRLRDAFITDTVAPASTMLR